MTVAATTTRGTVSTPDLTALETTVPRTRTRRRGLTIIEPVIWLVVAGILATVGTVAVGAMLDRAADARVTVQLEQLSSVVSTQVERARVRRLDTAHFATQELVETADPVYGTEGAQTVSVAVAPDGLDGVAALVSDSGHCATLTVRRDGPDEVAVLPNVDVSAGDCQASALLP